MLSEGTSKRSMAVSWLLVIAWACFIFFASAHTGDDFDRADDLLTILKQWVDGLLAQWNIPGLRESSSLGHFCEYAVFGALLTNALRFHMPLKQAAFAAVACASLYGVTDELHQVFVPGRACDPADWAVDTCGSFLGSLLCLGLLKKNIS